MINVINVFKNGYKLSLIESSISVNKILQKDCRPKTQKMTKLILPIFLLIICCFSNFYLVNGEELESEERFRETLSKERKVFTSRHKRSGYGEYGYGRNGIPLGLGYGNRLYGGRDGYNPIPRRPFGLGYGSLGNRRQYGSGFGGGFGRGSGISLGGGFGGGGGRLGK